MTSLLGWWKCDETAGTTLADSSGHARTVNLNSSYSVGVAGISTNSVGTNKAVDFTSGYGSRAGDTTLRNLTNWTLGAWINLDTFAAGNSNAVVGMTRTGSAKLNFAMGHNLDNLWGSGQFGCGFYDNTAWRTAHWSTPLSTGTTYFLAASYDGTTMKFYVDGSLKSTTTPGGTNGASDGSLILGRYWGSDTAYLDGRLDDVVIFDGALSDGDVSALFADMNYAASFVPRPPIRPIAVRNRQAGIRAASL